MSSRAPLSPSWDRGLELFDDQPIIGRLAGRVRAVPILEHRTLETLSQKRVMPGPQTSRHIRRQADVRAGGEHARQMSAALQERHREQRLAVDFQEVEGGKDLSTAVLARIGVALIVHLEIALVPPVGHEHPVDDGRFAASVGHDRVVELPWSLDRAGVAAKAGATADADEHTGTRPLRLEDVTARLGPITDHPRALRRDVRAQKSCHPTSQYPVWASGVRASALPLTARTFVL